MHQIICGEIPKTVEILEKKDVDDFLEKEKDFIERLNGKTCLYSNKFNVKEEALNYLNYIPELKIDKQLKLLILNEYNACEKLFPYLGDFFLYRYFKSNFICCFRQRWF